MEVNGVFVSATPSLCHLFLHYLTCEGVGSQGYILVYFKMNVFRT